MGMPPNLSIRKQRKLCNAYGHRPVNNWGYGDLPAPWAQGDIVEFPDDAVGSETFNSILKRLNGMSPGLFIVISAFSIDEGDGWYFRVSDGKGCSDRLHVIHHDRCEFDFGYDSNYMLPFRLIRSVDPEGLIKREEMLKAGWSCKKNPKCPTCGAIIPNPLT